MVYEQERRRTRHAVTAALVLWNSKLTDSCRPTVVFLLFDKIASYQPSQHLCVIDRTIAAKILIYDYDCDYDFIVMTNDAAAAHDDDDDYYYYLLWRH